MTDYSETTISAVFIGRCKKLMIENHGAALAVTLAFVMPIYLMVIGIYAVGDFVRNKIELQNAADAAAYSASVVQADYLSRMATVNKAMAWTYVDLQKRSLDLAMASFTAKFFEKFDEDWEWAETMNLPCHMHVRSLHYNCGTDLLVTDFGLNWLGTGAALPDVATDFNGQNFFDRMVPMQKMFHGIAEISGKGVIANTAKVAQRSRAILKMTAKLEKLKKEYAQKIEQTAREAAIANMRECPDDFYVKVDLEKNPFKPLLGTKEKEKDFIAMADPELKGKSAREVFGPGTDDWLVFRSSLGFSRVYKQTETHLYAKWDVFWTAWKHVPIISLHLPPIFGGSYDRKHTEVFGTDCELIQNDLPIGLVVAPAIPVTIMPDFFGRAGTITVAIVRKSSNPFSFLSSGGKSLTAEGILSAFNPAVADGHRPEFMCAISTARAGYCKDNTGKSADYLAHYPLDKGVEWMLDKTDWDGMLLPVNKAWSTCTGTESSGIFTAGGGDILADILLDRNDWVDRNGKKAKKENLPDWEKLQPPSDLIRSGGESAKLDWRKLRDYLGH